MFEELYNNRLKDLPVNEISDDVMSAIGEHVSIISSPTGSGKTLTIPTKLADRIPDNERVVVLVPRKFLAINAAETVAELSNTTLGDEVGYAVGTQGGDEPLFNKKSKIIFATYGYAISSGMIFYEKNIVLDEVHEASIDMSISKALLQHRKENGEDINIIEMSATINLEKQQKYWENFNPKTFKSEGRIFDCEIIEDNNKAPAEHAVDLILTKARKGVAIFESGVANIEKTKDKIEEILLSKDIKNIEVAMIYGEMDKKERDQALKAPKPGNKKIIIGTNVIESGMNIPWLDAGVTSGKGKDLFETLSGAIALKEQDLPQWRLQQQKGRVARFTNGIFVLASYTKWAARNEETKPEISRLPLSNLVMDCASFGLKAEDLNFDEEINHSRLLLAKERLVRLKLIDDEGKLTKLGKFSNDLPVTVENAVVLKYAQSREYCLSQAIVMVAVSEYGNMRQDFKRSHGQDSSSDLFDGLKAFMAVDKEIRNLRQMPISKKAMESNINGVFAQYNMSKKRFYETKDLVRDLRSRLNVRFSTGDLKFDYDKLKQCLVAGNIERINISGNNIFNGASYDISYSSVVSRSSSLFLAEPRVIPSNKGGRSFTVNERVTVLTEDDIKKYISKNPDIITKVDSDGDFHILDSKYINNSNLKIFVEDGFKEKINDAMTILKHDGIEGFKSYVLKNPIPEIFWKDAINADSKTGAVCKVLSQPEPAKEYNLYEILGIEETSYSGSITISEADLKKFGLINGNKANIKLNPSNEVIFDINNQDLELSLTIVGNGSKAINLSNNELKSLEITSENENFGSDIYMEKLKAHDVKLHDLKSSNLKSKRAETNLFETNNIKCNYVEFDNSIVHDMIFKNSEIRRIDIYSINFDKEIVFDNTKVNDIATGNSVKLRDKLLYITITDTGSIIQSNRDPNQDKREYQAIVAKISELKSIYDANAEELLKDTEMSDAYKQQVKQYIENKIKEHKIIERKEKLRNLGLKVADSIPSNEIENADYKRVTKILSQLKEFKDFAKGDISEEELNIFVMNSVKDKRDEVYKQTLKDNAEMLKSEISIKGKTAELKAKLAEKYGLSIRDTDIERIQQENIKEKYEAEKQEKLSHVEEVAADKLIKFFENDNYQGFSYFDSVREDRRNYGYETVTRSVMQELGFEVPDDDIYYASQETKDLFYKIKKDVETLEREASKQSYFDEEQEGWVSRQYDFLADKAGYEPVKVKKQIDGKGAKNAKKTIRQNKKGETIISGLSSLAALKDIFNTGK